MIKIVNIDQWCNCYSLLQDLTQDHILHLIVMCLLFSFIWNNFSAVLGFSWPWHFFMGTGLFLCRICLNLDLSVSSWLDSDVHFGHIYRGSDNLTISVRRIQRHWTLVCPTLGGVKFNPWLRWCLSTLPTRKLLFFPLYLSIIFGETVWDEVNTWSTNFSNLP